jgi:hypothetical protein
MSMIVRTKLSAILAIAAAGCGGAADGIPREPISGSVTFDGQSLDDGQITFSPASGGEPVVGAVVKDGSFSVARAEGPSPGPHAVKVWSRKPTGKKVPSDDVPGTFIEETSEVIPARYNLNSELRAEVVPAGENRFTFDLKRQAAARKPGR